MNVDNKKSTCKKLKSTIGKKPPLHLYIGTSFNNRNVNSMDYNH